MGSGVKLNSCRWYVTMPLELALVGGPSCRSHADLTADRCVTVMPQETFFISDLYLFCRRFDGERFWDRVLTAAGQAEAFVLGGDIFDFRWTRLATIEETAEEGLRMLETLVASNRDCEFYFIVGNHDHHETFLARLECAAWNEPNLSWHPYFVRLGSSLFLHGDVATRRMDQQALAKERSRWLRSGRKGPVANWLYDLAVHAHLHQLVYQIAYPRRAVARNILTYLERIGHGPGTGIEDVYFGHTHLPLFGFTYEGVRLHNCGAPVKGCTFRILEDVV